MGYSAGIAALMRATVLFWASVIPAVQLVSTMGARDDFTHHQLIIVAFTAHALCWLLATTRCVPVGSVVVTWALICLTLASALVGDPVTGSRIVLNMSLTVGIAAAIAVGMQAAIISAVAVSIAAGVLLLLMATPALGAEEYGFSAIGFYAMVIPVYTVCTTIAVAIVTDTLRTVAGMADQHHLSRLRTEDSVARTIASAELAGKQSRLLHDTVINTLGAIARGISAVDDEVVRRRCRADVDAIDQLTDLRVPEYVGLNGFVGYAGVLGIDVIIESPDRIESVLATQPEWRRHEILGLIGESITNAAKHSGADRITVAMSSDGQRITMCDSGIGVADAASLCATLELRAQDAMVEVAVESATGTGTTITISIPPLASVDGQSVLTAAIAAIAARLVPVMLTEFLVVAALATAVSSAWSVRNVLPAAIIWTLLAATLVVLTNNDSSRRHLRPQTVVLGYCGVLAAAAVAVAVSIQAMATGEPSVVPFNLRWVSDAAAAVCIVFVLVDGRARVVLPPVIVCGAVMIGSLVGSGRSAGSILVVVLSDVLLILVFAMVRRKLSVLADEIERQHRRELLSRERLEREEAQARFRAAAGSPIFARSRALLVGIACGSLPPDSVGVRAEARVEESYLRALLAISVGRDPRWVGVIDAARMAQVVLHLCFHSGGIPAPDGGSEGSGESASSMIAKVVDALSRCRAGESVSVNVFGTDDDLTVDLVAESLADGLVVMGRI